MKGEHKKPEHVKPQTGSKQTVSEQTESIEPVGVSEVAELPESQKVHVPPVSLQQRTETYQSPVVDRQVRRPSHLLEPSSYPQVMSKQLPKYEGILKPTN